MTARRHPAAAGWRLDRGANVTAGGVRFSVWAPRARRVSVRIERGAAAGDHPLDAQGDGTHAAVVAGARVGDEYGYLLDGATPRPDPVSRSQPRGVHGPSRVVDPSAFAWRDGAWRGRALADCVIYELHVGTFTAQGTFDAVAARLPALRALGITAIELMPVAEFPGARNWGYDGTHLYAPQSTYGGPDGLRRLVDAAHVADMAVVLDAVYNHLSPEGSYVDNAVHWIAEYHVDGLRVDAIHAIHDAGPVPVLAELTAAVHAEAARQGRRAILIAESDLNDPRVVRSREAHGLGSDAQWADDFHHATHAALTGERSGRMIDFGGIALVAEALRTPFVQPGRWRHHRQRTFGRAADVSDRARYVACIQNHDQVGNRALGERLGTLVDAARQRLAAALLLLSPYVPMLFMGKEYGEVRPFRYFVSHGDAVLLEAVREGRRREFAAHGWGDDAPDPGDEAAFRRSTLDRDAASSPRQRGVGALYADLLALRRDEGALRPGDASVQVDADDVAGWIAVRLEPPASAPPMAGRIVLAPHEAIVFRQERTT